MNEKLISELRGKAQELATKTFPADHPLNCLDPENNPDDKIFMDRLHESYKVFAELIVRECMDLASAEQKRYANITHRDMNECAVALGNFSLLIKDHFEDEE